MWKPDLSEVERYRLKRRILNVGQLTIEKRNELIADLFSMGYGKSDIGRIVHLSFSGVWKILKANGG